MNGIIIRRPQKEEIESINEFFIVVLKNTFEKNGLGDLKELLEEEIQDKRRHLNEDFETDGRNRFFLLAEYNGEIIGTGEYGMSNGLLNRCTNNELKGSLEIGTIFVHPKYQKQGVSSLLLYHLFKELWDKEVKEICFDSGYKIAQGIWRKRFGEPAYYLKDYWGEGAHHMVWKVSVKEAVNLFKPAE